MPQNGSTDKFVEVSQFENHLRDEDGDLLDDEERRRLLGKFKALGLAALPVSMLLLDLKEARAANTGSTCELGC